MNIDLRIVSPLAKVFMDEAPAEITRIPAGFKNEVISFQAAWINTDEIDRDYITVTVQSDLGKCVTLRRVRHVPVGLTTFATADDNYLRKAPGLFPDLLSDPKNSHMRAYSGHWESAWIDITPDKKTPAGKHKVTVVITDNAGAELAKKSISVEILDASLPKQKLIHTKWFHCDAITGYYGVKMFSEEFWRIAENFIRTAAARSINMILTPIHTPPLDTAIGGERDTCQLVDITVKDGKYHFGFRNFDRWIAMCQKAGIKYFEMAHLFSQWGAKYAPKIMAKVNGKYQRIFGWETDATGPEYSAFLHAYVPALTRHIRKLGIEKCTYFHISDEPHMEVLEGYQAAKTVLGDMLKGFPVMDALSDFAFYETGAVEHPVPANNHIQPFIDANIPGLWTYYCVGQYKDVSNMFMAMPSARNRILGVQLYKFKIAGFLQWGYNFYNSQGSEYPIDPYLTTDGDGFTPAGDCFQVYPGKDGVPEESIRMMVTSEAMYDLRALEMLEKLKGREFVMKLVEGGIAPITFDKYPQDEKYLFDLRDKVNREIMKAQR